MVYPIQSRPKMPITITHNSPRIHGKNATHSASQSDYKNAPKNATCSRHEQISVHEMNKGTLTDPYSGCLAARCFASDRIIKT